MPEVAYVPYVHHGPYRKRGRPAEVRAENRTRIVIQEQENAAGSQVRFTVSKTFQCNTSFAICFGSRLDVLYDSWRLCIPSRGSFLLMLPTDITALDPLEILRVYGLRWKIEVSFKPSGTPDRCTFLPISVLDEADGSAAAWGTGINIFIAKPIEYREAVKRKLHAYHVFIQAGVVAQGVVQYLSVAFPELVWTEFRSWLRTIRPGIAPSEFVVSEALRQSLPYFLISSANHHPFAKFITERQDIEQMEMFRIAA